MKHEHKRTLHWIIWAVAAIAIAFAALAVWFVTGKLTQAKMNVLKVLPFPIAVVNGQPVLAKDFIFRYELLKNHPQDLNGHTLAQAEAASFNSLISEKKIQQVAAKHDVYVPSKQIDIEYKALVQQESSSTIEAYLKENGVTESSFKNVVLKPNLLLINLQTWFYGQKDLNTSAYELAQSIRGQVNASTSFASLAQKFTQDEQGKLTKGDMGYIPIQNLLPELQEAVDSMSAGEIKIIPSRYGIHILTLEDKDNNGENGASRLHIRQIFLNGSDFSSWLNQQTGNLIVRQLITL